MKRILSYLIVAFLLPSFNVSAIRRMSKVVVNRCDAQCMLFDIHFYKEKTVDEKISVRVCARGNNENILKLSNYLKGHGSITIEDLDSADFIGSRLERLDDLRNSRFIWRHVFGCCRDQGWINVLDEDLGLLEECIFRIINFIE